MRVGRNKRCQVHMVTWLPQLSGKISRKLNQGLHFPKPAPCSRVSSEIGLFLMQTPRYKRNCNIDS